MAMLSTTSWRNRQFKTMPPSESLLSQQRSGGQRLEQDIAGGNSSSVPIKEPKSMFKTYQTLLIVITATWLSAGHDSASAQWHNTLQLAGKTSAGLTMTKPFVSLHCMPPHPIIMTFARASLDMVGHKPHLYDPSWGVTFWIGR